MLNPYANVDWDAVQRIGSATHMHIMSQADLENGYRHGIRHFPISNYYPSAPYDADTRVSDFRLRQHWPARRTDGTALEPPVNWNEVITWADELDEPYRSSLPFGESGPVFGDIPDDVVISPNAEHHGFSNSPAHICSPGSTFISGNIDPQGRRYNLHAHGFCVGYGGTWQEAFSEMIAGMRYADAGGITINHPTWFSQFTDEQVHEMLDFDPLVLGIEIYNDYSATRNWNVNGNYTKPDEDEQGFSLNMWDRILSTGRRCWGFCVPDHGVEKGTDWNGRNVLLVPAFTERECLKAYREGRFYGCLKNNGLTVTEFAADESSISVRTNGIATIRFVTNACEPTVCNGEAAQFDLPASDDRPPHLYVRVEISDASGERLFLQPVMYPSSR